MPSAQPSVADEIAASEVYDARLFTLNQALDASGPASILAMPVLARQALSSSSSRMFSSDAKRQAAISGVTPLLPSWSASAWASSSSCTKSPWPCSMQAAYKAGQSWVFQELLGSG